MLATQPENRSSISSQVLLCVATVSMLLSGCAGAPDGHARTTDAAEVVDGYDCLAPNLSGWVLPPEPTSSPDPRHPDAPAPGRVPAGFTPIAAVRCEQITRLEDAGGQGSGVTAVTLTGDLTSLLEALAEPDERAESGPCTADMELVSPLWLVDATGRAILAHYPRDGCAKTKPGVHSALAGLSIRGTTLLERTEVVPRAAPDSGCAVTWTVPRHEGTPRPIPSVDPSSGVVGALPAAPTPIADTVLADVNGMRWCRYAVEPAPTVAAESRGGVAVPGRITAYSGRFVAGGTLDAQTTRLVADIAASEPVSRSCADPATMFLALWPSIGGRELGTTITVELDGCELLSRNGSDTRALPPDVLKMLVVRTAG